MINRRPPFDTARYLLTLLRSASSSSLYIATFIHQIVTQVRLKGLQEARNLPEQACVRGPEPIKKYRAKQARGLPEFGSRP